MKLTEIHSVTSDTLALFIRSMQDAPFTVNDIVIEFAPKGKMAGCARALCAQLAPDKNISVSQVREFSRNIDAHALIGKEKSAVIACINSKRSAQTWREIFFHEFMHIYCAKLEMDGDHFIDVYGSEATSADRINTPATKKYNNILMGGYKVWSEFIAQYYTIMHTEIMHPTYAEVSDYVNILLYFIGRMNTKKDKYSLSFACARLLTCSDAEEAISMLMKTYDEMPAERRAALSCLFSLHEHLEAEKPWKISEDFIADLGKRYFSFQAANRQMV